MKTASTNNPTFEEGRELLKETIEYNQVFAHVAYTNTYIIDIISRRLLCCEVNPIYLCGLSEMAKSGMSMDSFADYVSREDRTMISHRVKDFFGFLDNKDREHWGKYTLSVDFRLLPKETTRVNQTLVNHTLTPLSVTKDGRPWHLLVSVMGACNNTSDNARISCKESQEAWRFRNYDRS